MPITHDFESLIPDDPVALASGEVTPSRWNAEHKGHDLALHQALGIDALTAGEGIDITGGVITNTAHAPQDVTYAELKNLADTSALKPNGRYRLTDFRTYQLIPWSTPAEYVTGSTEVLLLIANSASELSTIAVSESYPRDIIYYELVCTHSYEGSHTPLCGGDRGWIYYREDTVQKNKLNYDFRACKWRRWYDPATDTYTIYNDNAEVYQDVYTFEDYTRVHNNDFAWGDSPDAPINRPSYNNVFYNTSTEVYANTGSVEFQNNTFSGRCYENRFGVRTSYNRFMGGVRYNNLKDNFNFAFIGGDFDANEINMDCSTWMITGDCTGNRVGRSANSLTVYGDFLYNFLTHNCSNLTFEDSVTQFRIASALSDYTFSLGVITGGTIGGDIPWDISYADLFTMYDNSTLIPGQKYRIMDFSTVYTIPNTAYQLVAGVEQLVVTAIGTNLLSHVAVSEAYPYDIIHYEIVCQHTWDGNPIDATMGWIYYRKDTANNNEAPFDLRGCVWRRWETSVGSGVYTEITDPGNGEAYLDFSTFSNGKNNVIAEGGFNIVMGTDCNYNRILLPNSKNLTLANSTSNYLLDFINGGTSDLAQAAIQIRRDLYSYWINNNPVLAAGEIALASDQVPFSVWIGNGSSDIDNLTPHRLLTETEWGAVFDGGNGDSYHNHPNYTSSFYLPTAITVTYGTLDAGDYSYLYSPSDGFTVDISEANGANALQLTVDFTDTVLLDPNALLVRARYAGGSNHSIAVEIYNYSTPGWEILGYISNAASQQIYSFPLFNGGNYRSGSTSSVRFRHIESGNVAHDLFLDWVSVARAAIGGGGVTEHSALGGLAHADHPESALILSDNTTNDVSTTAHGFCPKAPNDTTKFLRGDGTWEVPSGGSGLTNPQVLARSWI